MRNPTHDVYCQCQACDKRREEKAATLDNWAREKAKKWRTCAVCGGVLNHNDNCTTCGWNPETDYDYEPVKRMEFPDEL